MKKTIKEFFEDIVENCSVGGVGAGAINGGLAIGTIGGPEAKVSKTPKKRPKIKKTIKLPV